MSKFYFVITILIIVAAVLISLLFFSAAKPLSKTENWQEFELKSGWGLNEIVQALKNADLISSTFNFKLYTILTGRALSLKPGNYFFSPSMSLKEIVQKLWRGPNEEIVVTIPEGFSLKDIDGILAGQGIIIPEKLSGFNPLELSQEFPFLAGISSLEGYLFPDTYRFFSNSGAKMAAEKMLENFQQKVLPLANSYQADFQKTIILASLIEKEVISDSDRALVSGILIKRLESDMPLQVDATVIYVKCKGEYQNCPVDNLNKKDFAADSPFNTYLHLGLPPAPISNPGLSAIQAALNPQPSKYWYYLSDPVTKKTIFSKTLEEQNINRTKYLKI